MPQPPEKRGLQHCLEQRVRIVGGPDHGKIGTVTRLFKPSTAWASGMWIVRLDGGDLTLGEDGRESRIVSDDWLEPVQQSKTK